jgi:hypothetical protein
MISLPFGEGIRNHRRPCAQFELCERTGDATLFFFRNPDKWLVDSGLQGWEDLSFAMGRTARAKISGVLDVAEMTFVEMWKRLVLASGTKELRVPGWFCQKSLHQDAPSPNGRLSSANDFPASISETNTRKRAV